MNGVSAAPLVYEIGTSEMKLPKPYVISSEPVYSRDLSNPTIMGAHVTPTEWAARTREEPKGVYFLPLWETRREGHVFQLLQLWEGRVIEIGKEDFTAILVDKSNPTNPEEEAVIDHQEVPEDDRLLLRPGAIFYWSIGYEAEPGRPRQRVSRIRLRRIPGWTKRELDEAARKADQLSDLFL